MGDRVKLLAAIDMVKRSPHLSGLPNPEGLFYLNRYAIETAGSMGGESVVKYATDTKTGLKVCLKFSNNMKDFMREVQVLKKLAEGGHVPILYDFYEDPAGQAHCMVMERGEITLTEYMKKWVLFLFPSLSLSIIIIYIYPSFFPSPSPSLCTSAVVVFVVGVRYACWLGLLCFLDCLHCRPCLLSEFSPPALKHVSSVPCSGMASQIAASGSTWWTVLQK
jgi:hypothetical protein